MVTNSSSGSHASKVRVSVLTTGGKKALVHLPSNVPTDRLVPHLTRALGMAGSGSTADGRQEFHLSLQGASQLERLSGEETLEEAGVQSGAVLRLTSNMRAGGRRLL